MRAGPQRFISPLSAAIVVASMTFGLDTLALSGLVVGEGGTFWWFPMLLAGALGLGTALVVGRAVKGSPGADLIDWARDIFGRRFGAALGFLAGLGHFILAAYAVSLMARFTQLVLLPNTPVEILLVVCLVLVAHAARQDGPVVVRLITLVFVPAAALILASAATAGLGAHWRNALPLVGPGFAKSTRAMLYLVPQFRGVGALCLFAPYLTRPDKAASSGAAAMGVGIVGSAVVLGCTVAVLGALATKLMVLPTVVALQAAEVTSASFERLDLIIYIAAIIDSFVVAFRSLYLGATAIARATGLREHKSLVVWAVPLLYLAAVVPGDARAWIAWRVAEVWLAWLLAAALPTAVACCLLVKYRRASRGGGVGS